MTPGSLPRAISSADEGGEAEVDGAVGERGQGAGDLGEVPGAAEVGEGDEERGAALGDAQAVGERGRGLGRHLGEDRGERRLGRGRERLLEPVGLAGDQAGEEGRAAGGAFEQGADRLGLRGEAVGGVGGLAGSWGRGARTMRSARTVINGLRAGRRPPRPGGRYRGRGASLWSACRPPRFGRRP